MCCSGEIVQDWGEIVLLVTLPIVTIRGAPRVARVREMAACDIASCADPVVVLEARRPGAPVGSGAPW